MNLELRDLIVTPILLLAVYGIAYFIRSRVTDSLTRVYFIPALTVKIFGAVAVGLIYQFYYGGGDTFNYHSHGSRHIWEAFVDSPVKGIRLLINDGQNHNDIYRYTSKIVFFTDPQSYSIVKIAAVLDLITFSSYSATAILFAIISFIGMWMLFLNILRAIPTATSGVSNRCFFYTFCIFLGVRTIKGYNNIGLSGCCYLSGL